MQQPVLMQLQILQALQMLRVLSRQHRLQAAAGCRRRRHCSPCSASSSRAAAGQASLLPSTCRRPVRQPSRLLTAAAAEGAPHRSWLAQQLYVIIIIIIIFVH
jgi:hypothetical protein